MKLVSAYIENYGGIEKKAIDFRQDITEFCEENGYGKTTLASFIKAMFYGLPSYKTNSVEFTDRERFYPFNGGKFGGNLTFVFGGKTYKIERFFDKKSSARDELKLYENGDETECEYDLGKRFFALDERSFARTVFFGEDDVSEGVALKLGESVQGDGDVSFEQAAVALEKSVKKYKALRGDAGILKDCRLKKRDLSEKISDLKNLEKNLAARYAEKAQLTAEAETIRERYRKAVNAETQKARCENYERNKAQIAANNAIIGKYREKYPCGIPTEKEIDAMQTEYQRAAANRRALESEKLSPQTEYELKVLKENLNGLNGAVIAGLQNKTDELTKASARAERLKEEYENECKNPIINKFEVDPIDPRDEEELDEKMAQYREIEQKIRLNAETAEPENKRKFGLGQLLVLIGLLVAGGGAALFVINKIAAVALIALGCVTALCGAFVKPKNKTDKKNPQADLQVKENLLKEEINELLARYGYYSRDGVAVGYSDFKSGRARYSEVKNGLAEKRECIERLSDEISARENGLKAVYERYGINVRDYHSALAALIKDNERLVNLSAQAERHAQNAANLKAEIAKSEEFIRGFATAYKLGGDVAAAANELRGDRVKAEQLKRSTAELSAAIEDFKNKYGETPAVGDETLTIEELNELLNAANKRLAQKNEAIAADEAAMEALPDAESALEVAEEELAAAEEKYSLLRFAEKYLAEAEKKIKDEYVAPVMSEFLKYAALTEDALGVGVDMDKDFRVRYERNGEYRSEKHLSAGQRAVLNLCLRLAIAKQAFKTESPFVVMDDPFVALDEKHFARVKEVLKDLSSREQIIYFTCHPSRALQSDDLTASAEK